MVMVGGQVLTPEGSGVDRAQTDPGPRANDRTSGSSAIVDANPPTRGINFLEENRKAMEARNLDTQSYEGYEVYDFVAELMKEVNVNIEDNEITPSRLISYLQSASDALERVAKNTLTFTKEVFGVSSAEAAAIAPLAEALVIGAGVGAAIGFSGNDSRINEELIWGSTAKSSNPVSKIKDTDDPNLVFQYSIGGTFTSRGYARPILPYSFCNNVGK